MVIKKRVSILQLNIIWLALASVYKVINPVVGEIGENKVIKKTLFQAVKCQEVKLPNAAEEIWDVELLVNLIWP